MKYIVITSKHHDGFAMFKSKVSPYNVADATPFKRDVLKELADACAKRGMRLGFYYSQSQDWHEKDGAGNTWDFGPDQTPDGKDLKNYDSYLRGNAKPQVRELLTAYGSVALIWFDTPRMTPERGQRFADLVRTLQPNTLIDGRLGTDGDYRSTGDNVIPPGASTDAWETPATINDTWGSGKTTPTGNLRAKSPSSSWTSSARGATICGGRSSSILKLNGASPRSRESSSSRFSASPEPLLNSRDEEHNYARVPARGPCADRFESGKREDDVQHGAPDARSDGDGCRRRVRRRSRAEIGGG